MKKTWTQLISRISTQIHDHKQRIIGAGVLKTLRFAFGIVFLELFLLIISVPMYIFIAPEKLGENEKEVQRYRLKRKVSVISVLAVLLAFMFKFLVLGGMFLSSEKETRAMSTGWQFNDPSEYVFDSSVIQIVDGIVLLRSRSDAEAEQSIIEADDCPLSEEGEVQTDAMENEVPLDSKDDEEDVSENENETEEDETTGNEIEESDDNNVKETDVNAEENEQEEKDESEVAEDSNTEEKEESETMEGSGAEEKKEVKQDEQPIESENNATTNVDGDQSGEEIKKDDTVKGDTKTPAKENLNSGTENLKNGNSESVPESTPNEGGHAVEKLIENSSGPPQSEPEPEILPEQEQNPVSRYRYQNNFAFGALLARANEEQCVSTIQPLKSTVANNVREWTGFTESAQKNDGEIYYQLSDDDGETWYYWNDEWTLAESGQYNTAKEIDAHIAEFPIVYGHVLFKAFFVSDCETEMQLLNIEIGYEEEIGAMAHWNFDEGSGETAVDSVRGVIGSAVNAEWTDGVSGSGLRFKKDGYMEIPDDRAFHSFNEQISVSAWVRWDQDPAVSNSFSTIVFRGLSEAEGSSFQLRHSSDNAAFEFVLSTSDMRGAKLKSVSQIEPETWYLVTGTYDGSDMKLYVNGIMENEIPVAGALVSSEESIYVGSRKGAGRFFPGVVDDLCVHNDTLTAEEILETYKAFMPVEEGELPETVTEPEEEKTIPETLVSIMDAGVEAVRVLPNIIADRLVEAPAEPVSEPVRFAEWNFDSDTGDTVTDSNGNHDGTLVNATRSSGVDGSGVLFDGSGDYVEIPPAELFNDTGAFTASAWLKTFDVGRKQNIMGKWRQGKGNNRSWSVFLQKSKLTCAATPDGRNGNKKSVSYAFGAHQNMWTHVSCSYDGEHVSLYVNGEAVGSKKLQGVHSVDMPFFIGARDDGPKDTDRMFEGFIDDVRYYDTALDAPEIRELYDEFGSVHQTFAPVAHWAFDEGSGSIVNDSVGNNDGTVSNATWIEGYNDSALRFGENRSSVLVPHSNALNVLGSAISLEAWIKTDEEFDGGQVIFKNDQYLLSITPLKKIDFTVFTSKSKNMKTNARIPDTNWHHVVVTYDGSRMKAYLDGVKIKLKSASGNIRSQPCDVAIGYQPGTENYFEGALDEVKIWDRVLSDSEVMAAYLAHTGDADQDGDGYSADLDCNDEDPSVHPGMTEICNGIDDDCDGETDENVLNTYYRDQDGDGYGNDVDTVEACEAPQGYVNVGGDTDDSNDQINPGTNEVCGNYIDENGDGYSLGCAVTASPDCATGDFVRAFEESFSGNGETINDDIRWIGRNPVPDISAVTENDRANVYAWRNIKTAERYDHSNEWVRYSASIIDDNTASSVGTYPISSQDGSVIDGVGVNVEFNEGVATVSGNNLGYAPQMSLESIDFSQENGPLDVNIYQKGKMYWIELVRGDTSAFMSWTGTRDELSNAETVLRLSSAGESSYYDNVRIDVCGATEPAGAWDFNENAGTTVEDLFGNNDGVVYGATWTNGVYQSGMYFDGIDDYIETTYGGPLGSVDRTFAAWIRVDQIGQEDMSVFGYGNDADGEFFDIYINAQDRGVTVDSGTGKKSGSTPVVDGEWHHIAVTTDDSDIQSMRIYVDGALSYVSGIEQGLIDTQPGIDFTIGKTVRIKDSFNGSIDNMRVYERVLTSEEIELLYTEHVPGSETCSDGVRNQNETGIDCGGVCDPCEITYQLEKTQESVSFVNESGTIISETTGPVYVRRDAGNVQMQRKISRDELGEVSDPNQTAVADVELREQNIALFEVSGDFDISAYTMGSSPEGDKTWLHMGNASRESIDDVQLLIPKHVRHEFVRICPDADEAEDIYNGCVNETILRPDNPSSNGYTLVDLDDDAYWRVRADTVDLFSTGGEGSSDNLILRYSFDEGAGSVVGDSAGNYDGTVTGATWMVGADGNALSFDGNGDVVISSPTNDIIGDNAQKLTVSAWFNTTMPETGSSRGYLISLKRLSSPSTLFAFNMGYGGSGKPSILTYTGQGHTWLEHDASYNDGQWHHIVGVIDGEKRTLYIDGIEVASDMDGMAGVSGNTSSFTVGAFNENGAYGFDGVIDDLQIYDYALSSQEVSALYDSTGCHILYSDNFEDNDVSDWVHAYGNNSGWNVLYDGNHVFSHTGSYSQRRATMDPLGENFTYTARMRVNEAHGIHGLLFRYTDNSNFWRLVFESRRVSFRGRINRAWTDANNMNSYAFTPVAGETYEIRMQVNGDLMLAKWWPVGDVEPSDWMLVANDDRLSGGGAGLVNRGSADYDDITVSNCVEDVSIPDSITVEYPNGGEVFTAGSTQKIEWGFIGTSGNVGIEYSEDDFVSDVNVMTASTESDGEFLWEIPNNPSDTMKIRIRDVVDNSLYDISADYFGIYAPSQEPISFWSMDCNEGCSVYDMVDDNTGIMNPQCPADGPEWTIGKEGYALSFDGDNDHLKIENAENLNPSHISVSAWAKWNVDPATGNSWAEIVSKNGDNQYQIQHNRSNSAFEFAIRTGERRSYVIGDTVPQTDTWYFVVGTYDGERMKLYVNGTLEGSKTLRDAIVSSTGDLHIGNRSKNNDRAFNGVIDEVGLWNRALSSTEIGVLYAEGNNQTPELTVISAEQQIGTGQVRIEYELRDTESNVIDITAYEYSVTGDFAGEELSMTQAAGNLEHDGVSNLSASPNGENHVFMWNAPADISDAYYETVHIRMKPDDGLEEGVFAESGAFTVDVKAPISGNVVSEQSIGENTVETTYDISDNNVDLNIEFEISEDGGAEWNVAATSVSGDIGVVNPGVQKRIAWDAGTDFDGREQSNMMTRIRATDAYGNVGEYAYSDVFELDTKNPLGLENFAGVDSDANAIVWSWTPVSVESNFKKYEIWYGKVLADVLNRTGSAVKWDDSNDADLNVMGAASTRISGLDPDTTYHAKIWAVDGFGNEIDFANARFDTESAQVSQVQRPSGGGSGGFIFIDRTPPFVPVLDQPRSPAEVGEIAIAGTAEIGSYINAYVDGGNAESNISITQSDGSFSGIVVLSEGERRVRVTATDAYGNESEFSEERIVLVNAKMEKNMSAIPETQLISVPIVIEPTTAESIPMSEEAELAERVEESNEGETEESIEIDVPVVVESGIELELSEAIESPILGVPEIISVSGTHVGDTIGFSGTGVPHSEIVVFIHSEQALVYKTNVSADGTWVLNHSQSDVELENGLHEAYAITLDTGSNVKSKPGNVFVFTVEKSVFVRALSHFDIITSILTLCMIVLGIVVAIASRKTAVIK